MTNAALPETTVTLRDRFKTATRDAILEAAASVFARAGAAHVRIEDIAAGAGVAVGTLYNYFRDRSELVGALLELRTAALLDGLDVAVRADAPFEQRLARFVEALAAHFEANRPLLSVLLEEERGHGHDARTASRRLSVMREVLGRAEPLLAEGVRSGALREGDPRLYAALLVGMVRGMVASALTGDTRLADAAPVIVGVFLMGAGRR
jgi:AcrR family transcriptional regulator